MKEFVYGTDAQYEMLKESLRDHLCHVYEHCAFPASFNRSFGRIGFEQEEDTYALYIDKGLRCSSPADPRDFREWLSTGTLRFLDFNDMKVFLRSLSCLY